MPIPKNIANKVLTNLDLAAGKLEGLVKSGKADPRLASVVKELDAFADRFQVAAFGPAAFRAFRAAAARKAAVFQKDPDEKYMSTFENPNKVISGDADEASWMKGGNFDVDRTTTVSERKEYAIRDLSTKDGANATTKQPSWKGGPAGKSTRQGSTEKQWADETPRRASREKTWAD
jgi:hypothetical protein